MREKALRQILRILGSDPFAPQKKIKRPPINAAELGERFVRLTARRIGVSCGEHKRPARRIKGFVPRPRFGAEGIHSVFYSTDGGERKPIRGGRKRLPNGW